MLIYSLRARNHGDRKLGLRRDVLITSHELSDSQVTSRRVRWVVIPPKEEGDVVGSRRVLLEYPVQDRGSRRVANGFGYLGSVVGPEANQPAAVFILTIRRYADCARSVRGWWK